jgi:hypothetical protein
VHQLSYQKYKDNSSNQTTKSKHEEQVFEQFLKYLYLDNTNQSKYRSILSGFITQQSLGNDQYFKMITEANNILSNHKFDTLKLVTKISNMNLSKLKPEQVIYPLLKWKENSTLVARQGTNP